MGISGFSSKMGGVGKIESCFKEGVSLIFILTLSKKIFLSVWWECECVLFISTISNSILCISRKELGLTESNQQICDFYKRVIFEKQSHCGTL